MMKKTDFLTAATLFVVVLFLVVSFMPDCSYAFEVSKTRGGKDIKWNTPHASYQVNDTDGPTGSLAAILSSMQTWTDVPTSSFQFEYQGQTTTKVVINESDGQNIVDFQPLGKTGTLAFNQFWYYLSSGEIVETDIVVNTSYSWATDGSPSSFDVQNIITHELGHSLSLADLYDPADSEKTMYGYAEQGETKKRTLTQDDMDGITYLYPGSGNMPPQITSFTASPTEGAAPLTVSFSCAAIDPDGVISQYTFDFGDGAAISLPSGFTSHTYSGVGDYTATCMATDDDGASAASSPVTIAVSDPTAWVQVPGILRQVSSGDLNGDGLDDLAGLSSLDQIYYSTDFANWNFVPGKLQQLAVGDLNGDGYDDLVGVTQSGNIYQSLNLSTWQIAPGILSRISTGDLNGDGKKDMVGLTETGQIYYTLDMSNWQVAPGNLDQIVCGDVNGDGMDDVVGLAGGGLIFYSLDLSTWQIVPGILAQITTGDFNGDGKSDLAGVTAAGQIFFTLDLSNWQTIAGTFKQLTAGDVNGDGRDDFIGLTAAGQIFYRLN